jgi:hypothetical protein
MNPSSNNSNETASAGDPQDNVPAAVHAVLALKSMAYAAKRNPSYLPHLIGIATSIDVNELSNYSMGSFTSKYYTTNQRMLLFTTRNLTHYI